MHSIARFSFVAAALFLTAGSVLVSAQSTEGPTTAPSETTATPSEPTTKPARARPIRLTVPWNKVPDLSDEQKSQINAIHVETIEKIKALEAAEDEACLALLTPEQRTALEETLDKEAAERKSRAAKKKQEQN
jgi:hypothetical protein